MDLRPLHHTSHKIYCCFATSRRQTKTKLLPAKFIAFWLPHGDKQNTTILQGFVPLTCNYRSKKRQFSLLPSNLRGRQVSYHLSIILCENLCNILFIYNELSYTFINSVFYYHCEQLRAHRPDK